MIKQVVLGAALLVALASAPVSLYAKTDKDTGPADTKKVFVCKYVGTPGVDERLQTGNNPISVSVNSIKDYNGVGSYFADAQGRSYVLAEDTTKGGGQEGEPSVDDCPAPEVPTTPETPGTPGTPVEPGRGNTTPPTTPTPVVVTETPQPAADVLPYTAGDHTFAIALIAAGLATIVAGLGIGINALYRRSA